MSDVDNIFCSKPINVPSKKDLAAFGVKKKNTNSRQRSMVYTNLLDRIEYQLSREIN